MGGIRPNVLVLLHYGDGSWYDGKCASLVLEDLHFVWLCAENPPTDIHTSFRGQSNPLHDTCRDDSLEAPSSFFAGVYGLGI